ncbi:LysR family transcriptional regulator [Polycladidibacter hongkongensis]|uniref:LysR family transcriptional regulator n=1 Tax=Polycladidibacter hongkongensis TaxID=1647556 RepID=UPI0008327EAD|nr:LysR family transcriptional regulator [Pseudovibrio hongkongensis]
MADPFSTLDWTLVRSFVAVAKSGSLTAAASLLDLSQPTVGRHIKELEALIKLELFTRVPKGLELSGSGRALLPLAEQMAENAAKFALAAVREDHEVVGTVRISASRVVSEFLLPDILVALRRNTPQLQLELHSSDESDNLLFREADIAVRMYRPTQLDMIAKRLGDMQLGLFASEVYLTEHGTPKSLQESLAYSWVGYDKSQLMLEGFRRSGVDVGKEQFALRCDDQTVYWHLIAAGAGIGAGPLLASVNFPQVRRVMTEVEIPALPIWLTMPEALRNVPRFRRAFDALVGALTAKLQSAANRHPTTCL